MTEAEWLAGNDPEQMIRFIPRSSWGERRGRLFAVSCSRILRDLPHDRIAIAIEIAERFADGNADETELDVAIKIANKAVEWEARRDMTSSRSHAAEVIAATVAVPAEEYKVIDEYLSWISARKGLRRDDRATLVQQKQMLSAFVQDIVGNPFRPVTINPSWLTSTVLALANGIYSEKAFDRMPILADALQDAGCDNADIIDHCCGTGVHVRGCFVVDQVLGKT